MKYTNDKINYRSEMTQKEYNIYNNNNPKFNSIESLKENSKRNYNLNPDEEYYLVQNENNNIFQMKSVSFKPNKKMYKNNGIFSRENLNNLMNQFINYSMHKKSKSKKMKCKKEENKECLTEKCQKQIYMEHLIKRGIMVDVKNLKNVGNKSFKDKLTQKKKDFLNDLGIGYGSSNSSQENISQANKDINNKNNYYNYYKDENERKYFNALNNFYSTNNRKIKFYSPNHNKININLRTQNNVDNSPEKENKKIQKQKPKINQFEYIYKIKKEINKIKTEPNNYISAQAVSPKSKLNQKIISPKLTKTLNDSFRHNNKKKLKKRNYSNSYNNKKDEKKINLKKFGKKLINLNIKTKEENNLDIRKTHRSPEELQYYIKNKKFLRKKKEVNKIDKKYRDLFHKFKNLCTLNNNFSPNNKHKGSNRGQLKYYSPKYYNTISILTSNFHHSIKKKKSPIKKTLLANEPKKNLNSTLIDANEYYLNILESKKLIRNHIYNKTEFNYYKNIYKKEESKNDKEEEISKNIFPINKDKNKNKDMIKKISKKIIDVLIKAKNVFSEEKNNSNENSVKNNNSEEKQKEEINNEKESIIKEKEDKDKNENKIFEEKAIEKESINLVEEHNNKIQFLYDNNIQTNHKENSPNNKNIIINKDENESIPNIQNNNSNKKIPDNSIISKEQEEIIKENNNKLISEEKNENSDVKNNINNEEKKEEINNEKTNENINNEEKEEEKEKEEILKETNDEIINDNNNDINQEKNIEIPELDNFNLNKDINKQNLININNNEKDEEISNKENNIKNQKENFELSKDEKDENDEKEIKNEDEININSNNNKNDIENKNPIQAIINNYINNIEDNKITDKKKIGTNEIINIINILNKVMKKKAFNILYKYYIQIVIIENYFIGIKYVIAICKKYPFIKLKRYLYNYQIFTALKNLIDPFKNKISKEFFNKLKQIPKKQNEILYDSDDMNISFDDTKEKNNNKNTNINNNKDSDDILSEFTKAHPNIETTNNIINNEKIEINKKTQEQNSKSIINNNQNISEKIIKNKSEEKKNLNEIEIEQLTNDLLQKILTTELKSKDVLVIPKKKFKYKTKLKNIKSGSSSNSTDDLIKENKLLDLNNLSQLSLSDENLSALNDSIMEIYTQKSFFFKTVIDKKKFLLIKFYQKKIAPKLIELIKQEIELKYDRIYKNISKPYKNNSNEIMVSLILQDADMLRDNFKIQEYEESIANIIDKENLLKKFEPINIKIREHWQKKEQKKGVKSNESIENNLKYDQYMNKCLIDCAIELINCERKYGENGNPLFWSSRNWELAFKYPEKDPKKLSEFISRNLFKFLKQKNGLICDNYENIPGDIISSEREKRLINSIKTELDDGDYLWRNLEMEETQIKVEMSDTIVEQLYNEVIEILEHIQLSRNRGELYQYKSIYACDDMPKLGFQQTTTTENADNDDNDNNILFNKV